MTYDLLAFKPDNLLCYQNLGFRKEKETPFYKEQQIPPWQEARALS